MDQSRPNPDFADLTKSMYVEPTPENKAAFELNGALPDDLANHTVEKTYNIIGISPDDFIKDHGSTAFDFEQLMDKFRTICIDFMAELDHKKISYAVDFCSRVIYEIAPDSRKGKRNENKTYRLKFIYEDEKNRGIETRTCIISTYRGVEYNENYIEGVRLCLTVRLASMLAVMVLNMIVPIGLDSDIILLTPLAGACFSKDDIVEIANVTRTTTAEVIRDINSSCQSGGHHIENGKLHIALCSSIVATKGIKDERMRDSIISKTIKQYYQVKKPLDDALFTVYAGFATGGIPGSLSIKALIAQYDTAQTLAAKQMAKASAQTMLSSTVHALQPGPSYSPGPSGSRP